MADSCRLRSHEIPGKFPFCCRGDGPGRVARTGLPFGFASGRRRVERRRRRQLTRRLRSKRWSRGRRPRLQRGKRRLRWRLGHRRQRGNRQRRCRGNRRLVRWRRGTNVRQRRRRRDDHERRRRERRWLPRRSDRDRVHGHDQGLQRRLRAERHLLRRMHWQHTRLQQRHVRRTERRRHLRRRHGVRDGRLRRRDLLQRGLRGTVRSVQQREREGHLRGRDHAANRLHGHGNLRGTLRRLEPGGLRVPSDDGLLRRRCVLRQQQRDDGCPLQRRGRLHRADVDGLHLRLPHRRTHL